MLQSLSIKIWFSKSRVTLDNQFCVQVLFLGDIFFSQEGIWGGGTGTKKHTNISASSSQKIVSIIGKNYAEFQDQLLNCVVEA